MRENFLKEIIDDAMITRLFQNTIAYVTCLSSLYWFISIVPNPNLGRVASLSVWTQLSVNRIIQAYLLHREEAIQQYVQFS